MPKLGNTHEEQARVHVDGFGSLAKIGLIYLHSSVVMESEMWAMAAPGVSIHTSRLKVRKITVDAIDAMMRSPELEQSARLVAGAPIDVLCFGGTSASFLHGTAFDETLIVRMRTGLRVFRSRRPPPRRLPPSGR